MGPRTAGRQPRMRAVKTRAVGMKHGGQGWKLEAALQKRQRAGVWSCQGQRPHSMVEEPHEILGRQRN